MKHDSTLIRPGTLAEQITAWCQARRREIGALTVDSPTDIDTDELVVIWDQLDTFHREFSVWVRDIAVELGHRLDDQEDRTLEHPIGILEGNRSQSVQWDGRAVLSGLAQPVVDRSTGDIIQAVPVDTLEQVLPGVSGVSSRWKVTELPDELRKHRTVTYGPTLPRRIG